MYSFEGQFVRKPHQSFGGASKKLELDELLSKVVAERQQREESKRHIIAAIGIQSFFRRVTVQKTQREKQRVAFDEIIGQVNATDLRAEDIGVLISRLLFFYNKKSDFERLSLLTKLCVQGYSVLVSCLFKDPQFWQYKIQRLATLNVLSIKSSEAKLSINIPLRYVEIFTSYDTYASCDSCPSTFAADMLQCVWSSLIPNSYFQSLKIVLERKVPSSLVRSPNPPTPTAATLQDLFFRPFLLENSKTVSFLTTFFLEVFNTQFSQQVSCFLLPAFASWSNDMNTDILLHAFSNVALRSVTIWTSYTYIYAMSPLIVHFTTGQISQYLQILMNFLDIFPDQLFSELNNNAHSDPEDNAMLIIEQCPMQYEMIKDALSLLNHEHHVNAILSAVESSITFPECIVPVCALCQVLLNQHRLSICDYRLLYSLAFKPVFMRNLWKSIISASTTSVFSPTAILLQCLSQGMLLSSKDQDVLLPQLTIFCALLNHTFGTLHDFEFYAEQDQSVSSSVMPFNLEELASVSLILRDVCIGLIDLAYPETRPILNPDYIQAVGIVSQTTDQVKPKNTKKWNQLLKHVVMLLRQLYSRDSRRRFCPEGQWISKHFSMSFTRAAELHFSNCKFYGYDPFVGVCHYTRQQLQDVGPPPSATEVRQIAILREFPFVIHFHDRVKIFQSLIAKDKEKNQGYLVNFAMGPQIHALIRRNYIYEDAFDNLSHHNHPNLKLKVVIQLVNAVGLDEAGIDGGGVFREFLNELLKTCFDPNRGFFKTTHDCQLYPNPGVSRLLPDFVNHYYFVGRMLGKAIYENMLVELPFAAFFLAKILGQQSSDVDIHHLASLDPVMYKNLLSLKTYQGKISDLGLDFTTMNSEFGTNELIELKLGGADIPVTESNCISYIHLMSDYKLNKQIKVQCQAFKEGLANVIDLEWLYMFDPNELQVLISGAHVPIDINDLKSHTNYAGGYSHEHRVIQVFWAVVESFSEKQRRQLLKFVTSCSRPPLLGFKELTPAFCIQNAGQEPHRLPTASTCMNLLKLPEFEDEETLKAKLVYAIESDAGFELS